MYNYYYEYDAIIFDDLKNLVLDESYLGKAQLLTTILCVLAFGLMLYTAISIRKARPLGIIVAVLQPVGLFAAMKSVVAFSQVNFSALSLRTTGATEEEAMDKLTSELTDALAEVVIPQMKQYNLFTAILAVVTIVSLVYVIILLGAKARGYAVAAFIIMLLRTIFIAPVNVFSVLFGTASQSGQMAWDAFFGFAYMLPILLIAAQGLSNMIADKKAKNVVAEAPVETTIEE